jgi:hypothetical protein
MAVDTCAIMRVMVRVEKSGSLKSGVSSATPRSASFAAKKEAFDDFAEDAKPWR